MASESHKKLSSAQQSDIFQFLQSNKIHSIGTYSLGKTIGEGSFGKVKLATHNLSGQKVAIKIVDKIHAPYLVREIETWRQLHHPNIAKLYEVLTSETKIYMVMEYCQGGEMLDYITKTGRMDDDAIETRQIFLQIAEAVAKCHEKNFAHRDLKLENILLSKDFQVKLIDFGFTRWANESALLDTYCGSSAYCAPEIVSGQKYSGQEADVWSLGVVLYTMVVGYLPFDSDNDAETHRQITEINYTIPDFVRPEPQSLITSIFKKEPKDRPTIAEVLNHAWLEPLRKEAGTPLLCTPSSVLPLSKLGKSSKEMILAAKLEAAGFAIGPILEAVHSNACNQLSAMWHLLLEKEIATNSMNTEFPDRVEIKFNEVDHIFVTAQKRPADASVNPLLHLASFDNDPSKLKGNHNNHNSNPNERPRSADLKSQSPQTTGRRKHLKNGLLNVEQQQHALRPTGSAGLLRISERMKSIGISEEDETRGPNSPTA